MATKTPNYQQVRIPPIKPELVDYIDAVPMIPAQMNQAYESNKLNLFYLESVKKRYTAIIEKESKCLIEISREKNKKYDCSLPQFKYARHKFQKYFYKYHYSRFTRFQKNYALVVTLLQFFRECIGCHAPISFKREVFTKQITMEDPPDDKKLSYKIISLGNYAKALLRSNKKLEASELLETLHRVSQNADETINYIPPNEFDTQFMLYAVQNGLIKKFVQFAKQMPHLQIKTEQLPKPEEKKLSTTKSAEFIPDFPMFSENPDGKPAEDDDNDESISDERLFQSNLFDVQPQVQLNDAAPSLLAPPVMFDAEQDISTVQTFNFKEFNQFVQFFFIALNSDFKTDKKVFTTMRCASIRILFDVYYNTMGNPFYSPYQSVKYFMNIENSLKKSPETLGIQTSLYPAAFKSKPAKEIFGMSNHFANAIETIINVQFFNNPLDIAFAMYNVISEIQNGIRESMNINSKILDMSFDDLFGFLIPVFALNPTPSPVVFHKFLSAFEELKISTTLEYSCTCLKAILAYFMENKN